MLSSFDWIRRCQTGAELLATLESLGLIPDVFAGELVLGSPFSALGGPCQRCWVYTSIPEKAGKETPSDSRSTRYCRACRLITTRAATLSLISRRAVTIWGYVNQLPRRLEAGEGFYKTYAKGTYIHDQNRFLLMLHKKDLHPWLQELAMYHGPDLKGHLQVFPTIGRGKGLDMGELICRAMHHEARFAMDQLRVRFYSAPHQLLRPRDRDRQGILTFEAADFLSLLEMAMVFKSILFPREQDTLFELLWLEDPAEKRFYWGRFLGYLHQEAKDMLTAWNIRQWPENRVKLLYELIGYVVFEQTD